VLLELLELLAPLVLLELLELLAPLVLLELLVRLVPLVLLELLELLAPLVLLELLEKMVPRDPQEFKARPARPAVVLPPHLQPRLILGHLQILSILRPPL